MKFFECNYVKIELRGKNEVSLDACHPSQVKSFHTTEIDANAVPPS